MAARRTFVVVMGPEWKTVQLALAFVERKLPLDIHGEVREATYRGAAKAKAKALTIPAHGPKHRGTRRTLSRGVGVRRTAYGYRVTTSMPPGEQALPRGFEHQWRHPVFGGPAWVIQHSHYPWFTEPISNEHDNLFRGIVRALNDAAQTIDRAS